MILQTRRTCDKVLMRQSKLNLPEKYHCLDCKIAYLMVLFMYCKKSLFCLQCMKYSASRLPSFDLAITLSYLTRNFSLPRIFQRINIKNEQHIRTR